MSHECPRGGEGAVERERAAEVDDGFLVLREQRIVVSHDNACLRAELVGQRRGVCEEGEFRAQRHNVEDVGVDVEGVETVGM